MLFGVANNRNAHAQPQRRIPFGHGLHGVIGALRVDVGTQSREQRSHVRLVEDGHVTHNTKGGDKLRASVFRQDRAVRSFDLPHARVGIDGHHEHIALLPRAFEVAHVTYVQKVEAAIREHDALPARALFVERAPRARPANTIFSRVSIARLGMLTHGRRAGGVRADCA